jgi:hypothetical protein
LIRSDIACPPWRLTDSYGFLSENLNHDMFVSAVHLGSWVRGIPNGCEVFTEQQLRRIDPEEYPGWVPKSTHHRPDGYWKVKCGEEDRVFALEVELSRKSSRAYGYIGDHYRVLDHIYRIVWVVNDQSAAEGIARSLKGSHQAEDDFHNFILLDDFLKRGWKAEMMIGAECGESLETLLFHQPSTRLPLVDGRSLLDCSKSPHKSATCNVITIADFRY